MSNYKSLIEGVKPKLEEIIQYLKEQLRNIQVGRADPAIVEDILVDFSGLKTPLKQLAAISCPEPRQILIQPWDKSYLESIQQAIYNSQTNLIPSVEEDSIRITLPQVTEEYRKKVLREVSEKQEEAKESLRRWRDEILKQIQKMFKLKDISEDDKFRAKNDLQNLIDQYNNKIDSMVVVKVKELGGEAKFKVSKKKETFKPRRKDKGGSGYSRR